MPPDNIAYSYPDVEILENISCHLAVGQAEINDSTDFVDTVAILLSCDLVVTTDTSIAHLAGALGVATWVVLKKIPEWRWQLNRFDSPWYPMLRLFRQKQRGVWAGAFADVRGELERLLGGG